MNKRTLITAVFAAIISLPLVVNAADEKKKGGGFGSMDANKDGKVTCEEYCAVVTKSGKTDEATAKKRFEALDTNKDKSLSAEEFAAGQKKKEKKS